MYILGISGHHRDAAAALLKDGQIVAAIEEEKLSRIRHIGISQCGGLPYEAIGYCLQAGGIGIDEIDYVTYDQKPLRLLKRQIAFGETRFSHDRLLFEDHRAASENEFHDRSKTIQLAKRLVGASSKVRAIDHQLSHASNSFYLSGFDRAAILIVSGKEDYISIALGIGERGRIRLQKRIAFPNSLGWVYGLISSYLGFSAGGEHNTQWLSLAGEPEFLPAFRDLIKTDDEGIPSIDLSYFSSSLKGPDPFSEKFYQQFGNQLRRTDQQFNKGVPSQSWTELIEELTGKPKRELPATSYRKNLAHSLQRRLEEVLLDLVECLRREQKVDALCLGGQVAYNSLLISKLEQKSGYKQLYVPPAAGNAGGSVGSALFQWHHQLGQGTPKRLPHAFLGPQYSDHEIKPVIDNCKLRYRYLQSEAKLIDEVVELLSRKMIVAWFQGRAEFGPRSLGARSILASPLHNYMKDNLNLFVKHREASRPFAAAVPEERAGEFFEDCSPLSQFLLSVYRVKNEKREMIPAACFSDGLARVQTVSKATNPLFWQLLNRFEEKTGVPVLVNTSFNLLGEPLVCSPREAIRGFYCSGIDALAINRFLLQK